MEELTADKEEEPLQSIVPNSEEEKDPEEDKKPQEHTLTSIGQARTTDNPDVKEEDEEENKDGI